MQPHLKNDLLYLLRILESTEKIALFSGPYSNPADFFTAKMTSWNLTPVSVC